ncbi:MAG: alpha/beta hydrolase [Actinomycetota bacterium]
MALTTDEATELFRREPERWIDTGGGEVAYRRIGSGPDVVFVHGWPVSGATFRRLLPPLADHVTCHVIDLPGTGHSRWTQETTLSIENHINAVRAVIDDLGVDSLAVVGHDSGGMIARYAVAGDERLRAMGLINTEMPGGLSWRFTSFLALRHVPGIGRVLGAIAGRRTVYRNKFVLGDAFKDKRHLDGEFAEFFLRPWHDDPKLRDATARLLRSFDPDMVEDLGDIHRRIDAPVALVWGTADPFFPVERVEAGAVDLDATLTRIDDAGLFSHEERPEAVAAALLPVVG